MNSLEKVMALLSLMAAGSGLLLSWLSHKRQDVSAVIDDLSKVNQVLIEENQRLGIRLEQLRKRLENETLKRVTLEERLDIARGVVDRLSGRVGALEAELQKYRKEILS